MMQILAEVPFIQPTPDDFVAGSFVGWFATIWGGVFALIALPWCVRQASRGDRTPLYIYLGGFLCSVSEPMWDHLTHLWWARDLPGPAFHGFDLDIPYFIPPAYMAFYALGGYFLYRRLSGGATGSDVWKSWGVTAVVYAAFEYPMLLLDAYQYYGDQPTEFYRYPLYNSWLNATATLTIGFLLWGVLSLVKDRSEPVRALFLFLVPVTGMCTCWSIAGWPNFMALNWPMPVPVQWLLAGVSLLISLLAVSAVAEVANRSRVTAGGHETLRASGSPAESVSTGA